MCIRLSTSRIGVCFSSAYILVIYNCMISGYSLWHCSLSIAYVLSVSRSPRRSLPSWYDNFSYINLSPLWHVCIWHERSMLQPYGHMYVMMVHKSSVIPHIILDRLLEVCKTPGTEGVCLKVAGDVLIYPFNWWLYRWVGHQHTNKQFLDNQQKSSIFFFSLSCLYFLFVF